MLRLVRLWVLLLVALEAAAEEDKVELPRDVLLVKVGGSSITHKATKETLNEQALNWLAENLAATVADRFRSANATNAADSCGNTAVVLVHGAGSFGHHHAKEFGLKGQSEPPPTSDATTADESSRRRAMQGLAETRRSVQKLNGLVVSALLEHDVNAVGISPCFGVPSMQAHGGDATQLQAVVHTALVAGLVPVLHGDACLYGGDAGILSGDTIMELLGPWADRAVFLTDVDGVFTKDPRSDPFATLLRRLAVRDGTVEDAVEASGSGHAHDVTGGLATKLKAAAAIASSGTNVTIARCQSKSATQALHNEDMDRGTVLFAV